jgi:hypothetical protein
LLSRVGGIRTAFSVTERDIRSALKEETHFTVFDSRSIFRIGAKGAHGSRERATPHTRRRILVDKTVCYLASPEDLIVHRVLSGTPQDVRDAAGIYVRQMPQLDTNGLKAATRRLRLSTELTKTQQRVRKRPDGLSPGKQDKAGISIFNFRLLPAHSKSEGQTQDNACWLRNFQID